MTMHKTPTPTFRRLRTVYRQVKSSKRGLVGLILIVFFFLAAGVGPFTTPHNPLRPVWQGYYPAGDMPAALELAVPVWYKYLPGGAAKYENFEVISDYQFSSDTALDYWTWEISDPNLANIFYNPEKGSRSDGVLEIVYRPQTSNMSEKQVTVKLIYNFTFPYDLPPRRFAMHASYLVTGEVSQNKTVSIASSLYRKDATPLLNYTYPRDLITVEDSLTVYKYPLRTYNFSGPTIWGPDSHIWALSTSSDIFLDPKYYLNTEAIIFPKSGNYEYEIDVTFLDKGADRGEVAVYLDNLNILMYGYRFGLMGTDGVMGNSKDIYTSLVYGARISVTVGMLVAAIAVSIGLTMGLIAGYSLGFVDEAIMRVADLLMVLPGLPLLIVLAQLLSPSIWNIVIILSLLGWMTFSRSIRSVTLSIRERTFVEAARAAGSGRFRILYKHLFPNVVPLVYLALAVSVPGAIIAEASLSFLGLYDPMALTWGRMLNEFANPAQGVPVTKGFSEYWFWVIPPGIAISMLAIGFILIGYTLDEIFNPQLRVRR